MNARQKAKMYKKDFLIGNGKGHGRDPLTNQRPHFRRRFPDEELTDLYATNAIVQNIIDIPAEDMTKNGFDLVMKDENLKNTIMQKLRDLDVKNAFKKMKSYERLHGDGFISLGVTQRVPFTLDQPLDPRTLMSVDYIHPFSGMKVNEFILNDDMFSANFGRVEKFQVYRQNLTGYNIAGIMQADVHCSRLIHDQTRRLDDGYEYEYRGRSLIEPLYDIITIMDTSLWSVGQILYDFVFKIYKSEGISDMSTDEKYDLGMLMNFAFKTEAMGIIGENEELKKESTNVSGIKELLDFVWDYLSGAVRMPKSVIKGQEAGTITGAQYDIMNYYGRIAAMQENEMRPKLEHLIRLLLWSSAELGGRIDPDKIDWKLKFNPLWQLDSKTDSEIRLATAQADQIYMTNGVLTPDEVRETRFGQFGLTNELKFNSDATDIDRMALDVYKAYRENH
jgi:phage-related protein (TIGR01555 family)